MKAKQININDREKVCRKKAYDHNDSHAHRCYRGQKTYWLSRSRAATLITRGISPYTTKDIWSKARRTITSVQKFKAKKFSNTTAAAAPRDVRYGGPSSCSHNTRNETFTKLFTN